MKFLFTLWVLLAAGSYSYANTTPTSFSNDQAKFLEELYELFSQTRDREQIDLYESFAQLVNAQTFDQAEFEHIVRNCNHMGEKQLRTKPYFTDYLSNLLIIKSTDIGSCNFENWHTVLNHFFQNWSAQDAKKLGHYYGFSAQFFEAGILRASQAGFTWRISDRSPVLGVRDGQPTVELHETQLTASRKGQEMHLYKTAGVYLPLVQVWEGRGGSANWTRLASDHEATVTLDDYRIDLKKGAYEATATLRYPKYFGTRAVRGTFHDKITGGSKPNTTYPRFYCTGETVELDLGNQLRYRGGFALEGDFLRGIAPQGSTASITKTGSTGRVFTLYAQAFSLKSEDVMSAKNVACTVHFGADSLHHPGINTRLEVASGKLVMKSGDNVLSQSPFFDSRRQVYVYADEITFDGAANKLVMNGNAQGLAADQNVRIESAEYFDEKLSLRLRNVADYHPIIKIYTLGEREGYVLPADVVARDMNPQWNEKNIQTLLFDLTKNGFVEYLPKRSLVRILPKTIHYAEVHAERKDFDLFRLESDPQGSNGEWQLDGEAGMTVRGVRRLELNRKQRVAFVPAGQEVELRDNRDLGFDGRVHAGFSVLNGAGFDFHYDDYKVDAKTVRYLDFYLPNGKMDPRGQPVAHAIGSRIEHATGTLLVNAPNNKSGREELDVFPTFRSRERSFVYYDLDNKLGEGTYPREAFYFELDPFALERLNKLTPRSFQFRGRLESAGIFPTIEETLRLQPHDQSLGIRTETPDGGLVNYRGKGTFWGNIRLSNDGLRGGGQLDYLATEIHSEAFVWTPEDMRTRARAFDLTRSAEGDIPRVHGADVSIHWRPYADSMYVRSRESKFQIFTETEHQMEGLLIYTPGGLIGNGKLDWAEGTLTSNHLDFGQLQVNADTANLTIKTLQNDGVAFVTDDLHGTMNFDRQFGKFKANDAAAITRMPYNKYETSLNEFEWNAAGKDLTFVAPPDKLGDFRATAKSADSLHFRGASARYDFTNNELKIGGVPGIAAADAVIVPDGGRVVIAGGGEMHRLEGASLTAAQKHRFRNVSVQIDGRWNYRGSGEYNHAVGEREQWIRFGELTGTRVGKRGERVPTTLGRAEVPQADFLMGVGFGFAGTVVLNSGLNDLHYDGYGTLDFPGSSDFRVDFSGDRNDLLVVTDKPKNRNGEPLATGIFLRLDNRELLPRLLQVPNERKDENLFPVGGCIRFDAASQTYRFADSLRLQHDLYQGNLLEYRTPDNRLRATGSFAVGRRLEGPALKLIGSMDLPLVNSDATVHPTGKFTAGLDLDLPRDLQRFIQLDLQQYALQAPGATYSDTDRYVTVLHELVSRPEKNLAPVLQNLRSGQQFVLPTEDQRFTFLLTHLDMQYDVDFQSFMTQSPTLGMSYFGKHAYGKMLPGILELKQTAQGDEFYLLFEGASGNWFYFGYKEGLLITRSNNEDYNEAVDKLGKERDRKTATGTFTIELGEPGEVNRLRNRARTHSPTDD